MGSEDKAHCIFCIALREIQVYFVLPVLGRKNKDRCAI